MLKKEQLRKKRHQGIRKSLRGTTNRPRAVVNRSNTTLSCQIIDDEKGVTLAGGSDNVYKGTKSERAAELGKKLAKDSKAKKVTKIVFDRAGYKYHGRVKALAEALREGRLEF